MALSLNEVDELLNNASAFDVNRLQVIDRQLEEKLTTLDKLDTDIQNLCDFEQLTQEIEESDHVTARILECRERIRVWNIQASYVNSSSMGQNPSSHHSLSTTRSVTVTKPNLPKPYTSEIPRRNHKLEHVLGFVQFRYSFQ